VKSFVAAFLAATFVAAAITPLVRRVAFRIGAVDKPGDRHVHQHTTPRLGGVAVFIAFLAPLVALFFVDTGVAVAVKASRTLAVGVLVGGFSMCGLGLVDDIKGLRAIYKLVAQIGAAVFAFSCGFRIELINLPFIGPVEMGIFALPVTTLWIVGVVNAVNLIDGLDGLAAGVVFFAALTNFVVAYVSDAVFVAALMSCVLGALMGFLFYNFNPARIFMGDSGSYFLGYVLATTSLLGTSQKASTTVSLLVPIIALGLPIFDTIFAMVRRFLERRPIFSPDKGHLHHRLIEMGFTHRRAVMVLYGVSVLFAMSAIGVSLGRNWQVGIAILGASVVVIGLVRFVGNFESVTRRSRLKARIRSRHAEILRRLIPNMPAAFSVASSRDALFEVLNRFGSDADMACVELLRINDRKQESIYYWEGPAHNGRQEGKVVSARFPIGAPTLGEVVIKFAWSSESGEVSPQSDIMLQLVADMMHDKVNLLCGDDETAQEGRCAPEPASVRVEQT
jgi:UDP-GlcNAc:undecaprenyl-phosphate GlcNAc-1-phosphate transferase